MKKIPGGGTLIARIEAFKLMGEGTVPHGEERRRQNVTEEMLQNFLEVYRQRNLWGGRQKLSAGDG
jgi:hypothetical protein